MYRRKKKYIIIWLWTVLITGMNTSWWTLVLTSIYFALQHCNRLNNFKYSCIGLFHSLFSQQVKYYMSVPVISRVQSNIPNWKINGHSEITTTYPCCFLFNNITETEVLRMTKSAVESIAYCKIYPTQQIIILFFVFFRYIQGF